MSHPRKRQRTPSEDPIPLYTEFQALNREALALDAQLTRQHRNSEGGTSVQVISAVRLGADDELIIAFASVDVEHPTDPERFADLSFPMSSDALWVSYMDMEPSWALCRTPPEHKDLCTYVRRQRDRLNQLLSDCSGQRQRLEMIAEIYHYPMDHDYIVRRRFKPGHQPRRLELGFGFSFEAQATMVCILLELHNHIVDEEEDGEDV